MSGEPRRWTLWRVCIADSVGTWNAERQPHGDIAATPFGRSETVNVAEAAAYDTAIKALKLINDGFTHAPSIAGVALKELGELTDLEQTSGCDA